jgi:hypothetical protein
VNTGDWVESCTAAIETPEGALEIVRWSETLPPRRQRRRLLRRAVAPGE